jgi:hypothetical protein
MLPLRLAVPNDIGCLDGFKEPYPAGKRLSGRRSDDGTALRSPPEADAAYYSPGHYRRDLGSHGTKVSMSPLH